MTKLNTLNTENAGVLTAAISLSASLLAGLACIGPLLGIALGVSSLGWLTRYSYLTLPASIASMVLLLTAIYIFLRRKQSCANYRRHLLNRIFLGITALIVITINLLEHVIFPYMS